VAGPVEGRHGEGPEGNEGTIAEAKCTLEATGTSAKGNAVRGKIMLVKEGGAWKLDEQFWVT